MSKIINKFEFRDEEDLFLRNNGKLELRFLGDGNSPYFYVPVQLWIFEKQMNGNNFFSNYIGRHHPEINREYSSKFWSLSKNIIPVSKKIPATEKEFNELIDTTCLKHLSTIDSCIIVSENNSASVKRQTTSSPHNKGVEIARYSSEDIHLLNKAYRKCIYDSKSEIIKSIYEEIAYQIYIDFTTSRARTGGR